MAFVPIASMAPRKSSRVAQAEAAKAADTPPPAKKDAKATKGKPANKPGPKPKANTAAKRADPEERTKKLPKAKAAVGDKATGKMPIKAATGKWLCACSYFIVRIVLVQDRH